MAVVTQLPPVPSKSELGPLCSEELVDTVSSLPVILPSKTLETEIPILRELETGSEVVPRSRPHSTFPRWFH